MGGGFGMGWGREESRSKPTIEPAAISSAQREQLFPVLGNLLGFSYGPTGGGNVGGAGGGTGRGQSYPGFRPQNLQNTVIDIVPEFSDMRNNWGAGTFSAKDVTQYFDRLNNVLSSDRNNPYANMFLAAMNNPYQATSAENQLLSNIMGQTSAQFANRGLCASPIAASQVAGSIAPVLIAMRQQQLANLLQGFTTQEQVNQNVNQELLTQRGQDVSQRQQDIDSSIRQRQQQMEGLLNFLESMGLSRNMGQQSASSGFKFSYNQGGGGGGGGGSPGGGIA